MYKQFFELERKPRAENSSVRFEAIGGVEYKFDRGKRRRK